MKPNYGQEMVKVTKIGRCFRQVNKNVMNWGECEAMSCRNGLLLKLGHRLLDSELEYAELWSKHQEQAQGFSSFQSHGVRICSQQLQRNLSYIK